MGLLGETILQREFVDLDQELERQSGTTIPQIIDEHGWTSFREQELRVLENFLQTKQTGYIGACGGGIVETPQAREALQQHIQHTSLPSSRQDETSIRVSFVT